jgi:hypothetical protein
VKKKKSQNPVHLKTKNLSLVLIPVLAYFSALPISQAVSPPADGGYPGGNTAEKQNALLSLTAGTYNTAVGWFSLENNLTGNFNTANGVNALLNNTIGSFNTAIGVNTLLNNTAAGEQHGHRLSGALE